MKNDRVSLHSNVSMIWFYLLVAYVFSSFAWWSFLLSDKNKLAFESQISQQATLYNYNNHLPSNANEYYTTTPYYELQKKYLRQRWMIVGEGSVFMLLLGIGTWMIYGTFTKEILLARQQNNFLLSITHELKSPLASIKLSLQTILKRAGLDDKFGKLMYNSIDDVDRLEMLVDNILLAAKVENSTHRYNMAVTDLSLMLQSIIDRIKLSNAERDIKYTIKEGINVSLDRLTFSSVIINLMENAIKYSPTATTIEVSLLTHNDEVVLSIKDYGIGIPDKEKSKVFGKFYRIGNEATRTSKGTGLGLFIVKRVVTDHGGKVMVANNSPNGSIFNLQLPLVEKEMI